MGPSLSPQLGMAEGASRAQLTAAPLENLGPLFCEGSQAKKVLLGLLEAHQRVLWFEAKKMDALVEGQSCLP